MANFATNVTYTPSPKAVFNGYLLFDTALIPFIQLPQVTMTPVLSYMNYQNTPSGGRPTSGQFYPRAIPNPS